MRNTTKKVIDSLVKERNLEIYEGTYVREVEKGVWCYFHSGKMLIKKENNKYMINNERYSKASVCKVNAIFSKCYEEGELTYPVQIVKKNDGLRYYSDGDVEILITPTNGKFSIDWLDKEFLKRKLINTF